MYELVEVLTEEGEYTGKNISKFEAHIQGVCHGISAIGLIDGNGRLLIQKRSRTKRDEPNKWDLSSAGHIDINETPSNAAIREMYEELGIIIEENDLELIDTYLNKIRLNEKTFINHFTYLYIVKKDIDINKVKMQKKEVTDIRFVNKQEYYELLNNGKMVEGIKYCEKVLNYIK